MQKDSSPFSADLRQEVQSFCSRHHLRLEKKLGQHFLVDQDVLNAILTAASIEMRDHIVEIGPGIGILTRALLHRAQAVTAIEFDERMIPLLQEFVGPELSAGTARLALIRQNALHTPFPSEHYKIVANIPYHITSPLLRHAFLESEKAPASMTLLIQREVAEKICSKKDAGLLTILVRIFGEPQYVQTVPPSAFLPPPKVDSAVLHIDCFAKPKASADIIEEVFRLTKIAFGQKRKMLHKSIGSLPDGLQRLQQIGIDTTRRPQTLSIDEWIALASCSA